MACSNKFETDIQPLLCEDPMPVINWLKEHELLKSEMRCYACLSSMKWMKHSKTRDGFIWKCKNKECEKYRYTISIRTSSFFAKSHITFQKWVHAMYLWSERIGARQASRLLNVSEKTMIDTYSCFREVCALHFEAHPIQLGGPGIIIVAGDSIFSPKPKKKKGGVLQTPVWVLGIVDTSTSPQIGYMEIVQTREHAAHLSVIKAIVRPGSIIHGNGWKAFRSNEGLDYIQANSLDHSSNGMDEQSAANVQTVESYLDTHRNYVKLMRGSKRDFITSYLQEFMWHERYSENAFEKFCNHIAIQYSE